jgi:hypothetical protein
MRRNKNPVMADTIRRVPRKLPGRPPVGRYSYEEATKEVERLLDRLGRGSAKQLAVYLDMTEAQFSHRMRGVYARFSLEHFGAIADWAAREAREQPPPGWPFERWRVVAPRGK